MKKVELVLAAGEIEPGAVVFSRFMAADGKTITVAVGHVLQGKLMERFGHGFLFQHCPPGLEHHIAHMKIVWTDGFAESAVAAGIDELVFCVGSAEDNEFVVEDLPGVFFGVALVAIQIEADLDALHTLALEATSSLGDRFFTGITVSRVGGRNSFQ